MARSSDATFYEEQPLRNNKLSFLAFVGGVWMVGYFLYAMYKQLLLGEPVGDRPMGDIMLIVFGTFYILLGVMLLYMYFQM